MYLTGEAFSYEINEEDKNFVVVGDAIIKGKEYIFAEDEDNKKTVFLYDDDSEELVLIDDKKISENLINYWQEEYYGTIDEVDLWEEDYEEEESYNEEEMDGFYIENEDFTEEEDDYNSYIEDLMDDDDDKDYY